jgi:hypothetical protein
MSRQWSSSEGDGDGSESLSESNAAICVEDLLDENDLFLWMIFAGACIPFCPASIGHHVSPLPTDPVSCRLPLSSPPPVFCIQGDSLDIASMRARPFQNFVRALDLHRSHSSLGVLQRARLEVLFASETAVCARDLAGSTAHATAAHTATAPFSARAMRFSQVIGRSPLRTHDSFPAAMARDLAPASSAQKSKSSSSSSSSSALVRAVKDRLASTPSKNSSSSSSTSLASNTSRLDRTAKSASAATAADPWAKLFASPRNASASLSAQTPRPHSQQRPKTANTLSGTGYNHSNNSDTVDLGVLASGDRPRPAKSVSFAGFKRLLLRLCAALKPNVRYQHNSFVWSPFML